jgi:hypothetical protein
MSNPNYIDPRSATLLPVTEWVKDRQGPNGVEVGLCDPYTGELFKTQSNIDSHLVLDTPPAIFANDEEAGPGVAYWRNAKNMVKGDFHVAILLTDTAGPEGLGDPDELQEIMESVDLVMYGTRRSVKKEMQLRAAAQSTGGLAIAREVMGEDPYVNAIKATAKAAGLHPSLTINFDPRTDVFGQPVSTAAKNLRAMEDAVRVQFMDQGDPTNPDMTAEGLDMVYTYMLGWGDVHQSGLELDRVGMSVGEYPEKIAIFLPADLAALSANLDSLGVSYGMAPAHDGIHDDPDHVNYPLAIDSGAIGPHGPRFR